MRFADSENGHRGTCAETPPLTSMPLRMLVASNRWSFGSSADAPCAPNFATIRITMAKPIGPLPTSNARSNVRYSGGSPMVACGRPRFPIKSRITMCCTGVRVVAGFCKFKLVRLYPVNTNVRSVQCPLDRPFARHIRVDCANATPDNA